VHAHICVPFKHLRGLIVVLDTDVAAVGCVGRVPGPGVAERVGLTALGTALNGREPARHEQHPNSCCALLDQDD
jgi:hypothetical protein